MSAHRQKRHEFTFVKKWCVDHDVVEVLAAHIGMVHDQHVAGLIMALEQSIVMGIALAWLFVRMLAESEAEEQRAERYA